MIDVGSKVKIKGIELKEGIIVELKDNFALVNLENTNQWKPISELEETSDELINRILKNDLDDGLDFILGIDAQRLLTEYKFNPYVLASSTKIQIFPHQIDEVIWALENPKILIADEVGLGKTIIAALVASELKARGLASKSLYVVPKSLVLKWRDELSGRFEEDVRLLNSEYVKVNPDPFNDSEFLYISSMDFLKQEHIMKLVKESFDVVVVDEAHKFKIGTDRFKLGLLLAEKSNVLIFLTATPHDGRDEDFMARIQLLNPYVKDIPSSNYLWTRNIKEDVIDIEGKKVFPPRQSTTVDVPLTRRERNIHELLDGYIHERLEEAQEQKERNAVRFLSHIFRKRGSSSIHALKITLERRLAKLGTIATAHDLMKIKDKIESADEEFENDYEDNRGDVETYTTGRDIGKEKAELSGLIKEIDDLGNVDSKLEVLVNSIKKIKESDKNAKLVIFTEYRDTLDYLKENLSKNYKVDKIDGKMEIYERKTALDNFASDNGPEILVCTDAAGEGIDMQFCNLEINYDLPWNPNKLEQRMGRIHRIGQKRNVYYYNYVIDKEHSIDGFILARLLSKIEAIKAAMGDKVYDIIGSILNQEDIAKVYEELLNVPKAKWEAKVSELLEEKIEENKKRVLEQSNTLLTGHRLDRTTIEEISKIRKNAVDKGEVKRFLHMLIASKDGKFEEINKMDEHYKIYPPKEMAISLGIGIFEGTFNRDLALEKNWPYLALGHKDINKILLDSTRSKVTVLKHPTKTGLLCVYKIGVIDGKGRARNGKIIGLFHHEDGKISQVDPRSIWDYDDGEKIQNTSFIVDSKNRIDEEIKKIILDFHKQTQEKLKSIEQKTRLAAIGYYASKIDQANSKIKEYEMNRREGPQIEKLITKKRNEIAQLKKDSEDRMDEIKKEFLSHEVVDLIGMAYVTSEIESGIRKEVEMAGMKAVMEYERKRASSESEKQKIIDVSDRDGGYDIESFDRHIEVKSFSKTGSPRITSHEWETSQRLKDEYWLYIVENALDEPKIYTFQNPYEKFKDKVTTEEVIDVRYVIENWKT